MRSAETSSEIHSGGNKAPACSVGSVFGRLTVVEQADDYITPSNGRHHRRWVCLCECGNNTVVIENNLKNCSTQSCGCLARELKRERWSQPHNQIVDLTGQRFGRLVAQHESSRDDCHRLIWHCVCDCGNECDVQSGSLRSGATKSCGCLQSERSSEANTKHGKSHKSRLYNVWVGMRQRCNDPEHKSYKNYGGRGISVCSEWGDYSKFEKWAMENGYDPDAPYGQCTIDRIDVNGNYSPDNCRWVNASEQAKNKR